MSYILEFKEFREKLHKLSGIALLVDNKICLVLPKKFKQKKKYSIPKGHIENGYNSYQNALLELFEETGVYIEDDRQPNNWFDFTYKKNGALKHLEVFVIKMTKDEFKTLRRDKRNKKEIKKVKFVSKDRSLELVENKFRKLINQIYSK